MDAHSPTLLTAAMAHRQSWGSDIAAAAAAALVQLRDGDKDAGLLDEAPANTRARIGELGSADENGRPVRSVHALLPGLVEAAAAHLLTLCHLLLLLLLLCFMHGLMAPLGHREV